MYYWRGLGRKTVQVQAGDLEAMWRSYPKPQSRSVLELQERRTLNALRLQLGPVSGYQDTGIPTMAELIDEIMRYR